MVKQVSFEELLSNQRSFIMGLSMIAIMLFHQRFVVDMALVPLHDYGHFGVDVFFFLSGMGIAISLQKSTGIAFYIKRVKRLIPAWLVVSILTYFIGVDGMPLSAQGFFKWFSHWWFLNTMVIFYLFSPILLRCVSRFGLLRISLTLVTILMVYFYLRFCAEYPWKIDISPHWRILVDWTLYRLPVYLLGVGFAVLPARFERYRVFWVVSAVVLFPLACFLRLASKGSVMSWESEYKIFTDAALFSVLAFAIPAICYLMAIVGRLMMRVNIYSVVRLFGVLSLELYLWHEWIYRKIHLVMKNHDMNGYLCLLGAIGLSLVLAWGTQGFCSRLMQLLNQRTKH